MLGLFFGSKQWSDEDRIRKVMGKAISEWGVDCIAYLDGAGASRIAGEVAKKYRLPSRVFAAKWKRYGVIAGMVRNADFIIDNTPDVCVCFHDELDTSRNSADMISRALKAGIPTYLVTTMDEDITQLEVEFAG